MALLTQPMQEGHSGRSSVSGVCGSLIFKTMQMDAGCTNACKALYNACLFNPHIISKTRSARQATVSETCYLLQGALWVCEADYILNHLW